MGTTAVLPDFPADYDIVFDLGGHIDKKAISAIKQSSWVLVPVFKGFVNMQVTIDSIAEILEINPNVIVIANRTLPGDYEDIRAAITKFFDLSVFEVKRSKCLPNIFKEKVPVRAMVQQGGLKRYHYQAVSDQFDRIIEYIQGRSS